MLPLVLLISVHEGHFSLPLIPVLIIVAYSGNRLARIIAVGQQEIVVTTFWVFVYIFLGLCPFFQILVGNFPWPGNYEESLLVEAGLVILVGILAFDIGHRFLPRQATVIVTPEFLQRPIRKATVSLLAVLAIISALYFQQQLGGMESLFMTRMERGQYLMARLETPEMSLFNQLARTPVYVILIAALAIWVAYHKSKRSVGIRWKLLILGLLVFTLILNNPIATARLTVGTILLSLFFILPWRRWYGLIVVLGLIVGLILVFPLADIFRITLDVRLGERIIETSSVDELTENGDFDAFQMVANTMIVTDKIGYQFGQQIGGALAFWVPRFIWPSKPMPTGELVAEQVGYSYGNLSAPLWAEFYVDGGWLLMVVGFAIYGALVRTLDSWNRMYQSSSDSRARVVSVLVPIYAGYQFFLLRGSLMPAIAYLTPMVLFALLCSVRLVHNRK
ncbi:MAG: O-antigen polymerase [Candidatus Nitrosoglobus sp.]